MVEVVHALPTLEEELIEEEKKKKKKKKSEVANTERLTDHRARTHARRAGGPVGRRDGGTAGRREHR